MFCPSYRMKALAGRAVSQTRGQRGYSMTEVIIVISIIGVFAGIAVGGFNRFLGGTKDAVAAERQERLNQGLHRFAQHNYELVYNSLEHSATDELAVLRTLQYRNTDEDLATIGAPYMDPRYRPVASSSDKEYRLRWTGKLFELLQPGEPGTGLLMDFAGTDFTTPFVFPPNFQMAGR